MANVIVSIPDGDYCSDKNYLGCKFCQDNMGSHYCMLHEKFLGNLETFIVDGNTIRSRRKCKECLDSMKEDFGKGYNKQSSI